MAVSVSMKRQWWLGAVLVAAGATYVQAQTPTATEPPAAPAQTPAAMPAPARQDAAPLPQAPTPAQGGKIHGTVVAGTAGKPGGIPLPGVAVTATNSLTGKKFATTTDIDGGYAMAIPRNGRYVVRVELAAFAAETAEVLVNAASENGGKPDQTSDFGLTLSSRVAAAETRQNASASSLGRGLQSLNLTGGDAEVADASANTNAGTSGTALPSLANLGDSSAATDSVAVSGRTGETNGLANFSEDEIRSRIEDAIAQGRANGMIPQGVDVGAIMSAVGGMMSGGGGPGGGVMMIGGGGGGRGGRGGGGGGNFRNFNPAQPHGNIFYQGGNNALNSAPWSPTLTPQIEPAGYQNRFGASIAGSPYIPGLFKPDTRQFVFINISGQKNLSPYAPNPVRVPTALERSGDFSQSLQRGPNGATSSGSSSGLIPVAIYDPVTGVQFTNNKLPAINAQALAVLNAYYPLCNVNCNSTDPSVYNYQTVTNRGDNNIVINTRYNRTLGPQTAGRFGGFGGGGGGNGGGGGRRSGNGGNRANTPPALRQSINVGFNYSHNAQDIRNIFLPLGGGTQNDGYNVSAGYTVGYGRLSNNASISWNRNHNLQHNYFTNTSLNPTTQVGLNVPNGANQIPRPAFYNGLPSFYINNFASITNTVPNEPTSQTISFSDFVSYRHKKHNYRFGFDIRRVHQDTLGGANTLGSYTFTGFNTESAADRAASVAGTASVVASGSSFADFLLGLPQQSQLQAGLSKIYLRENVYDGYAQDDWRILPNVTLNGGLRYEYFGPFTEKNNRLVNLDHNADFTSVDPVMPNQNGTYLGAFPRSVINPDYTLYSPRIGVAWHPKAKFAKETVIRAGYGINYNTTQYQSFAKQLSFQPPFAATQNNVEQTTANTTGCVSAANFTLKNAFNCSTKPIQNTFAVNRDYRLGKVQVYNLNIQRTVPGGIVLNVGYDGSHGDNLDIRRAPNHTLNTVTTAAAQAFFYEDSVAFSNLNQLVVSAQIRQRKGMSGSATYQYSHSIDNASSIGGGSATTVQNDKRLDLEEGNSSFDVRHKLTMNWTLELPFGPNRAFFNKGGFLASALDGFGLSGNAVIGSGSYFSPQYSSTATQVAAGGTYTLRPDRDFSQPIAGAGKLRSFFNPAAFKRPDANNGFGGFGTASRNSIQGPGTLTVNMALSRSFPLGDTRNLEARVSANNVFNTVQYNGINTDLASLNYAQVTNAAQMRVLQVQARYRF